MPNLLLKKLRSKKGKGSFPASNKPKSAKSSSSKRMSGMFRSKKITKSKDNVDDIPMIQPGRTWSMSEDESVTEEPTVTSTAIAPVSVANMTAATKKAGTTGLLTFTEQEVTQNYVNHMRDLNQKNTEIAKHKHANQELAQEYNKTTAELKAYYTSALEEQDMELAEMEDALDDAKEEIDMHKEANLKMAREFNNTIAEMESYYESALEEKDAEMESVQSELKVTKDILKQTSNVLMKTQEELFEVHHSRTHSSWLPWAN